MAPAKTKEQMELEILQAQHEKALLDLDETKETSAQRQQQKAQKSRANAERQQGFKTAQKNQEERFRRCTHRQGGDLNQLDVRETNQSALMVMKMPDDFTVVISCPVCRNKRVSPHPYLQRKTPFPAGYHVTATGVILERAETKKEVAERIAKYAFAKAEFDGLLKQSRDKLVKVPDMDCGTVHILTNSETGDRVLPWRQSDVWPYNPAGYEKHKQQEEDLEEAA